MMEQTITVTVPFAIRKRGGRKLIITPDGTAAAAAPRARVDNALLKALARAFRWKRMLDSGDPSTIAELAKREGITAPYLTRTLRLAQLAPELVEAILAGCQPLDLTLETLRRPLPEAWIEQKRVLAANGTRQDLA